MLIHKHKLFEMTVLVRSVYGSKVLGGCMYEQSRVDNKNQAYTPPRELNPIDRLNLPISESVV